MDAWVVVVDDEVLSLTNAKKMLGEEGMRVSCLKSGRELLKYVEKNTPDLIILDIMMPEMDGFETYEALRSFEQESGRAPIPVIFLTGDNDSKAEQRGLKAGASDFIHKPIKREILLSRIRNIISNSRKIETLTEEASTDRLTGFLNKITGTERIAALCETAFGTLIVLDLDNFKLVNDLYGHDMGDRMLQALSDIIRRNTREGDIISRIGGDEFMGFFAKLSEKKAISALIERLNRQMSEKAQELLGKEHGLPLGISAGAVTIPENGRDYEGLFSMADNAMYSVKQNGKHGCCVYDRGQDPDGEDSGDLEQEMDRITKIMEERNEGGGALLLGQEAFAMVYRFILRFYHRYGGCSVRLLFSLPEDSVPENEDPAEIFAQFLRVLQRTLRKSDLILQNRSCQCFVLLNERSRPESESVIERILQNWKEAPNGNTEIQYTVRYEDHPTKAQEQ